MGNVGANLRPTQVVDINGRGGTFVMQAGHTLPAFGQGIAAKSRKVVFFIDFFWRSTCSPVSSGVPTKCRDKGRRDMNSNSSRTWLMLVTILLSPLLALAVQQTTALLVDGRQAQAEVIQVQGKNYVEVDEIARITGGSLRFLGSQIILTLPGSGDTSSQARESAPAPTVGLSRPFLAAGIETMREILEWNASLKTAIERDYPLSGEWFGNFRRQIQSSLKHTEAAASTDMDREALPLLVNEFNNMGALTDKYLKIGESRDYLPPDSLNNDPLEQKLFTCWHSLESMASSNQFVDNGSCQ
jgi:hypothetical protein